MHAFKFSLRAFGLSLCQFLGALPMISPARAAALFPQPATTPENIKPEIGDFPYLPAMPGSALTTGFVMTKGFWLLLLERKEEELVAPNAIWKS